MILLILQLFYHFLPAYFANMTPVFARQIKILDWPINEKLFGSHKTWRGMIFGIIAAILISFIQLQLQLDIQLYNYNSWFLFGFLMGAGALLGDLIKSFFKRRAGIKPGQRWIPFDQMDFIFGAIIFSAPLFFVGFINSLVAITLTFFLHVATNHAAFYLKIRKEKW